METNPIQMFMDAQASMNELENEITKRIKGTLETIEEKDRIIACAFDKNNFQMIIYVDDREYTISVQGRGNDINKYLKEMLRIINEEFKY